MHRMISRVTLLTVLAILAVVGAACANLPPLAGGTPAAVVSTTEPAPAAPATPTAPAPGSPVPVNAVVVENARQTLATELGTRVDEIEVVSSGQVDWPNGCLGIETPGVMCTQAIVPGYQIILEVNGKQYEMRTSLTGEQIVLAPESRGGASQPRAAVLARERAAIDLGLELGAVNIVSVENVEWPDACLGVPDPAELCAQMVTPGYRVTVEANGQQIVYHTDESGANIRRERQPAPASSFPEAAVSARDTLAKELGVPADAINVQSAEPAQWPDSCLGAAAAGEMCAQVITPGFEVVLEHDGDQYVYHTNASGTSVRSAGQLPATPRGSGGQTSEPVIGLRRDVDGGCVDVRVDLRGVSFGACGSEMTASEFMTGTNRLEQLADMQRIYTSFGVSTPAGKVTFVGQGTIEATPVEQRMIAEWANVVALETRAGTRTELYGMEWHREGGIAGFCDDIRIDAGGHATLTSCKPAGAGAPTWRRLTSGELTQFYGGLDQFGSVQAEQKDPATADQMTVRASLAGRGAAQATDADKDAMLQFGAALLQQWADPTPVRHVSILADVEMRSGPGEAFDVVETIAAGQQALVTGVSRDSTWWRVICPDDTVGNCWVSGDLRITQPIAPAGSTGLQPGGEGQAAIDETQILAAIVRQVYTVDDTFGGTSRLPTIYLLAVDDAGGDAIPYSSPARPLPAPVQQGVVAALGDLPAQFKWVAGAGEVKRDQNNAVAGNAAIITVGKVQPQPDGTVRVTASIYLSPLAAGGQTYILENQGGEWKVTGTTGAQWIS